MSPENFLASTKLLRQKFGVLFVSKGFNEFTMYNITALFSYNKTSLIVTLKNK